MKAGDKVFIYEDPCTGRKCEGQATLVSMTCSDRGGMNVAGMMCHLEDWNVQFPGDGGLFTRSILVTPASEPFFTVGPVIKIKGAESYHVDACTELIELLEQNQATLEHSHMFGAERFQSTVGALVALRSALA